MSSKIIQRRMVFSFALLGLCLAFLMQYVSSMQIISKGNYKIKKIGYNIYKCVFESFT